MNAYLRRGGLVAAFALTVSTAACAGGSPATPAANGEKTAEVMVSTTPLGSVVKQITDCAGGSTTVLMPVGADPHDFAPSSKQITEMVKADLFVANGLSLEGGLTKVMESAKADGAKIYEVGNDIDPIPFGDTGNHEGHGHGAEDAEPAAPASASRTEAADGHNHGKDDPHFWLAPQKMGLAAERIGAKLGESTGNAKYAECGKTVQADMNKLNDELKTLLEAVPAEKRVLITDHGAFGYFAQAYDFEQAGVVIPGGSTEAEPSSGEISKLVETIKREKVTAIFSNTAVNPQLVQQVAKEAGSEVKVVPLYVGSVGAKGSGAETYPDMMRTNAKLIAENLAK